MKKLFGFLLVAAMLYACGGNTADSGKASSQDTAKEVAKVDDGKGVGEIKNVALNDPLDQELVVKGKSIYELKCAACHKLTNQRVVGPGFMGVTERRKPEWIMNMILNTEAMLAEDATAQALLEECLMRMPNQSLSESDGRAVLEFLYDLDSAK